MLYRVRTHASIPQTLHQGESFTAAKIMADNHKRDSGQDCFVESVSMVYTTQTLDEARAIADAHDAMIREARRARVQVGDARVEAARVARGVGDHPAERPSTDPDGPTPRARSHKSLTY